MLIRDGVDMSGREAGSVFPIVVCIWCLRHADAYPFLISGILFVNRKQGLPGSTSELSCAPCV